MSDEWFKVVGWRWRLFETFIVKQRNEFLLTFFGIRKYDSVMKKLTYFSFCNKKIIKWLFVQIFSLLAMFIILSSNTINILLCCVGCNSNIWIKIIHMIWIFNKSFLFLECFKPICSRLFINNWYFGSCKLFCP